MAKLAHVINSTDGYPWITQQSLIVTTPYITEDKKHMIHRQKITFELGPSLFSNVYLYKNKIKFNYKLTKKKTY